MIVIERRYCGPAASANGGYACGATAAALAALGPVEVTLRSPPPLDTALYTEHAGPARVIVKAGDQRIAEAIATPLALEAPAPVAFDDAVRASARYPYATRHPYPSCFVCGPARAERDGLRIFPGAVEGREVAAAPWIPDDTVVDAQGVVRPAIAWAALDCPSWFGLACYPAAEPLGGDPLLGRLTAQIFALPRLGERCVCVGWTIGRDGRKHHGGAALFAESGALRAVARATWIVVPATA